MVKFTQHSIERTKERCSKGHKSIERNAEMALSNGKCPSEFGKETRRYLENILLQSKANTVKVWGNNIYLFYNDILITVFPMNQKILRKENNKKHKRVGYDERQE